MGASQLTLITWDEACRTTDASIRQAYLDSLMHEMPDSTEEIVYDETGQKLIRYVHNLAAMRLIEPDSIRGRLKRIQDYFDHCAFTVISSHQLYADGKNHPIFAFPRAFTIFGSENNFRSVLVDHEGLHTQIRKYGFVGDDGEKPPIDYIRSLTISRITNLEELCACDNQIRKFHIRGVTDPDFITLTHERRTAHGIRAFQYLMND